MFFSASCKRNGVFFEFFRNRSVSWTENMVFFSVCRCTDINPGAAACTLETARCNKVHIQPIITDLVRRSPCPIINFLLKQVKVKMT